jgi:hypothetical protein
MSRQGPNETERCKRIAAKMEPATHGELSPAPGSEIDVEVIIRPQPTNGLGRHLGGVHPGSIRDNAAIAKALRKIADVLSPNKQICNSDQMHEGPK